MEANLRFTEEIDFQEISLLETVGKGAFGVVSKGQWRGKYVAVKMIESESERRAFFVEVRQLSRVNHPNIVQLYGACTRSPVCLVMEYAEGGSLYNVLHSAPQVVYNGGHAMSWALQCACGVEYLHNMKPKALVHRDLKPPNLLLVQHGLVLKICDFGTACDLQTNMTNSKGSAAWMAPEVFEGNKYSEKCDVFSWAIILWEVLARQKPFDNIGGTAFRIMWAVHTGIRPPLIKGCPKPLEDLMTRCWAKLPDIRPSMTQVVKIMKLLSSFFVGGDQPIEFFVNCDCSSTVDTSTSCSVESYGQAADSNVECNHFVHSPTSVTVKPKLRIDTHRNVSSHDKKIIEDKGYMLHMSNTAPASLSGSCESLSHHDVLSHHVGHASELSAPPKQQHQKRNSADLSNINFNQQKLDNRATHKRTLSYDDKQLWSTSFSHQPSSISQPSAMLMSPDTSRSTSSGTRVSMQESSLSTSESSRLETSSKNATNYVTGRGTNVAPAADNYATKRFQGFGYMDPQCQPLTPFTNCMESLAIFEAHRKMAQEFLRVQIEISLLNSRKQEINKELCEENDVSMNTVKYNTEYYDLQEEKESLMELKNMLQRELDTLKCQQDPQMQQLIQNNQRERVTSDGWVFV